jgi:hypothetical protein
MLIREWSSHRIKRLWIWGGVAEGFLIVVPLLLTLAAPRSREPDYPLFDTTRVGQNVSPAQRAELVARAKGQLESLGISMTLDGDSLVTFAFSDSEAFTAVVRNDTMESFRLTPAAKRSLEREMGPTVGAVAGMMGDVTRRLMLVLAGIYLPIPLLLIVVTTYWAIARRRNATAALLP